MRGSQYIDFVKWVLDPVTCGKEKKEGDHTEVFSSDQDILSMFETISEAVFLFLFLNQNLVAYGRKDSKVTCLQ